MAKTPGSGLFARVAQLVRNPSTGWGDLESRGDARADSAGNAASNEAKQVVKQMIDRKHRDDYVRKREFDLLRKIRRSEIKADASATSHPSFFHSSMNSPSNGRALTLKKINEIEAQMSQHWWKTRLGATRPADAALTDRRDLAPTAANSRPSSVAGDDVYARTQALSLQRQGLTQGQSLQTQGASRPAGTPSHSATQRLPLVTAPTPMPLVLPVPKRIALTGSLPNSVPAAMEGGSTTGFTVSKMFAIDVAELAYDPEIEEAAIRFANGENAAAEACLLEVIAPGASRQNHEETWLALFDLYRACGQHDRFENAALKYAARFHRSAPQWFSLPERVNQKRAASGVAEVLADGSDWSSPALLGLQSVAALNVALAKAAQPWRLDWARLNKIEQGALEPLLKVFVQWAQTPVELRFSSPDVLLKLLQKATPSGDKTVNMNWWRLRLEVLRVLHRPDEFELVALDYCVTYEVSPPSWEAARCRHKGSRSDAAQSGGHHTIIGQTFRDSVPSSVPPAFADSQTLGSYTTSTWVTVELAGFIEGDAADTMQLLSQRAQGAEGINITCADLVRVSFSAAGALVNWVSARRAEGRQIQFDQTHRLVAAFLNVMGISEHARVVIRAD